MYSGTIKAAHLRRRSGSFSTRPHRDLVDRLNVGAPEPDLDGEERREVILRRIRWTTTRLWEIDQTRVRTHEEMAERIDLRAERSRLYDELSKINAHLAPDTKTGRRKRVAGNLDFERILLNVAHEQLGPAAFSKVMDEAHRRFAATQQREGRETGGRKAD